MSKPFPRLTEMEEAFCHNYVENGRNGVQAAREAGYAMPEKKGWAILQKDHIKDAIEILYAERNRRLGVSRDYVLAELLEQLQILKADVKPKLNSKTGKPIEDDEGSPVFVRNEAGITKVLELIGKLAGVDAFNDKVKLEITKDQAILDAMEAGSQRLKGAPSFDTDSRTESDTDDLGVQSDPGDHEAEEGQ